MNDFLTYRLKKKYSLKSCKMHDFHVKRFLTWCIKENIKHEQISYDETLKFISNEKNKNIAITSIDRTLNSIKIYFDYLVETEIIKQNIIRQIKLQTKGKRVLPELLSILQLDKIYNDYSNIPEWKHKSERAKLLHQRNIVILGLLIYQGIDSGEIIKLETNHINLNEGKIYIPSTKRSNARTLKLQAIQILSIKDYIEKIKLKQTDQLFTVKKSSDMVCKIIDKIKITHPETIDSRQIKASIIMNWLKQYNIRQVQYMAGHKNIRSTEAYKNQDLTDLTKQLELFHPLK